jgi:putative transposase
MLRKQFPAAVPVMDAARDDVLAFLHFPQEHWRKVWSTNPLERFNKEIKRRTNVVGIFPNDAAIVRLVSSQLREQQEEWQLERRRFFSEATMAKIPETEEALDLTDADPFAQPDEPIS